MVWNSVGIPDATASSWWEFSRNQSKNPKLIHTIKYPCMLWQSQSCAPGKTPPLPRTPK